MYTLLLILDYQAKCYFKTPSVTRNRNFKPSPILMHSTAKGKASLCLKNALKINFLLFNFVKGICTVPKESQATPTGVVLD